jgi:Tfp pilus assembly protein PilF
MNSTATAMLLLALGCAQQARPPAVDPPSWSTPAGKQQAQLEMASSLVEMGRNQEALALLTEARAGGGPELEIDVMQARIYLQGGMVSEAAALLEPWQDRNPRDPHYHRVLGLVRFDQQQLDLAEAAFSRSLALEPDSFDTNNNLGFLLMVDGRPTEAVVQLRRALELRPGDLKAHTNLAFALAAAERDDEALELFQAIQPPALAYGNMGLACERRGARDQALDWYRRALEHDPARASVIEAIERLSFSPDEAPQP